MQESVKLETGHNLHFWNSSQKFEMHSFSWMSFGWKINQNNSWRRWDNTQHLLVVSYGPSRVVFFGCRDLLMLCISTSENNGKHSKIIKSTFVFLHASYMSLLCTWWKRYFFHHFWMFFYRFWPCKCMRKHAFAGLNMALPHLLWHYCSYPFLWRPLGLSIVFTWEKE